ncbi:30S ribosomal protein S17 [Candidatus Micrarchaeota archaeon]|nr:30S ribosomal protein S17 [Candidatus Micrarchaeota archaeon]
MTASDNEACNDKNCPRHGHLKIRGAVRTGVVVSTKAKKTAVVEIHYLRKVPKFERLEKRKSKIHAHVPDCIKVREGETVRIGECRKISKTKSHVVIKD